MLLKVLIYFYILLSFSFCNSEKEDPSKDKLLNACLIYGSYCTFMYDDIRLGGSKNTEKYRNCMDGKDGEVQIPPFSSCALYNEYVKLKE